MGKSLSLRAVERMTEQLEAQLPESIRRIDEISGWVAENVQSDLVLTLPICGFASDLSVRALRMAGVSAEKWHRRLPDELDLWSGHDIIRIGKIVVDPTPLSFAELVSLRPFEAQHNKILRNLYPQVGMSAVFKESEALEQGRRFANYLHRIEPAVRRELGERGLRDTYCGVDRDINGRLFGMRDARRYQQAVGGLWDMTAYEQVSLYNNQEFDGVAEQLASQLSREARNAA